MNIHESAEDYLEKILMLQEQKGSVRSIDIAVAMGYSKPSVSVAMKNLRENGYISMDSDGFIKLEAPGMEIANRIYGRHRKLTAFFIALGVNPDTAAKDACKVEHDLSEETYSKMIAFAEKNHAVGVLGVNGVHESRAPVGCAVDVGCDEKLHGYLPWSCLISL